MALKVLDKKRVGVGGPGKKSKYAYAYLTDDISYFPPTDSTEIVLVGDILLKPGSTVVKLYVTLPSQEYSYESIGEKDNRAFKVKFIGTHPGTEIEALEFAKKNQDSDFIIVIPEGINTDKAKVLGTPNCPLTFRSSHKSGKDGSKFELTFEQEVPSEDVYLHYTGRLSTEGDIPSWNPISGNLPPEGVYNVISLSDLMFTDGSVSDFSTPGKRITLIGNDNSMGGFMTLITGTKIFLRKNKPWKSIKGSSITLESYTSSDSQTKLIEIQRT
ncbi:Uncharacterised protein [Chryseobacterium nakagawai]|uniref:Uncharacterized protein n=1 Tax=Chryseobacterium nakagawai TaxID=1241982 RepID=A0AAD0YRW2_CHRNA|nr:hypothetical protein [Chryseobacterium nakagawai]AZA93038.1 hypothetical protein EG343_21760 [Chryseobacterium nakagawai]VEH19671.1 Uncharacterised protein [Chryseobacterium nakagawai]